MLIVRQHCLHFQSAVNHNQICGCEKRSQIDKKKSRKQKQNKHPGACVCMRECWSVNVCAQVCVCVRLASDQIWHAPKID